MKKEKTKWSSFAQKEEKEELFMRVIYILFKRILLTTYGHMNERELQRRGQFIVKIKVDPGVEIVCNINQHTHLSFALTCLISFYL